MQGELAGKIALVTAGSRGLGAEIVRELARSGADVAFTYVRDTSAAKALVKQVEKSGRKCQSLKADAADFRNAEGVVAAVVRRLGGLHIVVCNAGIARGTAIAQMTEADWDEVVAVTLKGAFNYIRWTAPHFIQQQYGKIVCIGSINGLRGRIGTASYNTAKAGLTGLVKTAAAELGRYNVNVNLVAPGFVETDSQARTPELVRDLVLDECAIKRLGGPADIAPLVAFLCSEGGAARYRADNQGGRRAVSLTLMKIVATIEARMESTRLPGKTLAPILDRPMLEMLIERLRRARRVEQIVVATTEHVADDAIAAVAERLGVGCFRGSSEDVLGRVLQAAQAYQGELLVEITGDCPLIDPQTIDECIAVFLSGQCDFVSNVVEPTYPLGLAVQVFPVQLLEEVAQTTRDPAHREHVSLYIYEHPEKYRLGNLCAPPKIRRPELRLTVDTAPDLQLVRQIYARLYPCNPDFSIWEVVELVEQHPELAEINRHVRQKPARTMAAQCSEGPCH